jgi:hypothetical protein
LEKSLLKTFHGISKNPNGEIIDAESGESLLVGLQKGLI